MKKLLLALAAVVVIVVAAGLAFVLLRQHQAGSVRGSSTEEFVTTEANALVEFPPAIAYGRTYYANANGTVFALDLQKVRVRWKFHAGRCTAASPAVARGLCT